MKSKHRSLIRISIILLSAIGLLLLLALGLQHVLASYRYDDAVRSSAEIPEGWEVVSKEDNITHIRLKEGSDAYYWVDAGKRPGFYLAVDFPGNPERASMKPDENGYIHVAIYMGYNNVPLEKETDTHSFRLNFSGLGNLNYCGTLYEFDVNTITTGTNVIHDASKTGLTEALIYSIPISELSNKYSDVCCFYFHEYRYNIYYSSAAMGNARYEEKEINYYEMHNMIHFDSTYRDSVPHKFPFTLYENYGTIFWIIAAIAILLALLTIWKKWFYLFSVIICAAGVVFMKLALAYYDSLPLSDEWFSGWDYFGEQMGTFLGSAAFFVIAVVPLIVHFILWIVRCWRTPPIPSQPTEEEPSEDEPPAA